jgi:galactokinase
MNIPGHVYSVFQSHFKSRPLIVRSPGRVNLIGEHTDYNEGFVLPAAVDKAAYVAMAPSDDAYCHWIASDLNDTFETRPDELTPSPKGWPNYLMGVVDQLRKAGYPVGAFNCVISSDVPVGAGMSSSAALECSVAFGLNHLHGWNIPKMELVKLAQKAENEFVGVKCGIMDQFASVFGKKGHVVRLDCRSLEHTYFPFMMDGIRIVLLDTGVKHSLADSEYNDRRAQCEEGVRVLQRHNPAIRSLRDADREILLRHQREFDPLIFNRCMYVVEENARLLAACDDLSRGDMISFGQRMYGSHNGLRDMYEVSCPELDYLVSFTITEEAVLGARMMGGGFGGCTINLVRDEAVDDLFERARKAYQIAMGRELKMYTGIIEDGTGIIDSAGF